jgi:hypothetical protein
VLLRMDHLTTDERATIEASSICPTSAARNGVSYGTS